MRSKTSVPDVLLPDLLARIEGTLDVVDVVTTIAQGKPNEITEITDAGVRIQTERSSTTTGPQLVPAWMLNLAWLELQSAKRLEASELVKVAKRSSAVCALLARLPGVAVETSRPITLVWEGVPDDGDEEKR